MHIPKALHRTRLGRYWSGDSRLLLKDALEKGLRGKVQLILTSPPYPLNRKKSYGNLNGSRYRRWLARMAPLFSELLTPDGSIVIELGNAWKKGRPVQSLLHLQSLLDFVNAPKADLRLCQHIICYNPARLPSPAAWVTVRKDRLTDSYTHFWWMAKSDFPKADTTRVLRPYSADMEALLKRGTYNNGSRPSQHDISKNGFKKRRKGSTSSNFLELEPLSVDRPVRLPNAFSHANTGSNDFFLRTCRKVGVVPHPARMPAGVASFFIQMLTDKGDLVLDPFAGSNTTGFVAELAGRKWISIERQKKYARQSRIRFKDPTLTKRKRKRRAKARRASQ